MRAKTMGALLVSMVAAGASYAQYEAQLPILASDRMSVDDMAQEIPDFEILSPKVTGLMMTRGENALERGIAAVEKAAGAEPKKREKLERRARGAFEEAERNFVTVLRSDPGFVKAYVGLARTWSASGQTEKALGAWSEAYVRAPESEETLLGLGTALMGVGRTWVAAAVYPHLLEFAPEAAPGYLETLRAWGQQRIESGEKDADLLLRWIEQQE